MALGLGAAATATAAEDEWQFEVTPYLLAAGMKGTVGVRDHQADVDMSFGDILDNLDGAFMALFTAKKGPLTLGFEGVYMDLEDDAATSVTGPRGVVSVGGKLGVTAKMLVLQGTVGYRVLDERTKVDVLGALRYTDLKVDADVSVGFTPPVFGGAASASGDEGWLDAVVGVRVMHPIAENVSLLGYADVGGGGSDLTYQFIGGVDWEFKEGFTARVGYRYLDWDYEDGGNVWDIRVAGPYLGLGIRF